jgi:hypothetical protein
LEHWEFCDFAPHIIPHQWGTNSLTHTAEPKRLVLPIGRGSLEELDRFGMRVDAVGEKDGMDLLAAVDCDEQLGITGRQRARFAEIHYPVTDLANPQHLASNT